MPTIKFRRHGSPEWDTMRFGCASLERLLWALFRSHLRVLGLRDAIAVYPNGTEVYLDMRTIRRLSRGAAGGRSGARRFGRAGGRAARECAERRRARSSRATLSRRGRSKTPLV
jgi:hypothetical protein